VSFSTRRRSRKQSAEAGEFLDKTPLAETVRGEIAFKNAVREFKLPVP
jgi:hypothetical protein